MTTGTTLRLLLSTTALCLGTSCARTQVDGEHWYFCPTPFEPAVHWSYQGDTGPDVWGDLDPSYSLAKTGLEQSPIDVPSTDWKDESAAEKLQFGYFPGPATFVNNGHTLQHDEGSGNWLDRSGKRYALKQFHFHTPSEHTLDGEPFNLEVHLVHRADDGEIAVVAVLARSDPDGQPIFLTNDCFPGLEQEKDLGGAIDPSQFLPADRSAYHYRGSFTTPPCTEDVQWFVMQQPIGVSADDISAIHRVLGSNHRPVQALNERTIGRLDGK